MAQESITTPVSILIDEATFSRLYEHLFPGDDDEHGAVLSAGIANTPSGTRLLVRDVFPAQDGVDYVPGTRGYRALTAAFVAELAGYCADENLCYLAVHCHNGTDSVAFSAHDNASHERGYPALLDIVRNPVGALVFAHNAVAGDIWTPNGRHEIAHLTVVGKHVRNMYSSPRVFRKQHLVYDRQTRIYGDVGQQILKNLKVGIIGLGGGGSLISEWVSKLGLGHIIAVDFDRVDITNLPRIVGATRWDAMWLLSSSRIPYLRRLGKKFSARKVFVARRVARKANTEINYEAIVGDVLDEQVAMMLRDCDFIFLASDSIQSRLVFNSLVKQYMIPGVQVGAKVTANKITGEITDIFTATRLVLPGIGAGCLECANCIPPSLLQEEAIDEQEREQQRYVDDSEIVQPSVMTLNVLSAAQAANDLMMLFTGLFTTDAQLLHQMHFVRERRLELVQFESNPRCPDCGERRSRGDKVRLPCRQGA